MLYSNVNMKTLNVNTSDQFKIYRKMRKNKSYKLPVCSAAAVASDLIAAPIKTPCLQLKDS